ncbi:MAG: YhgE/Pip family protein [Microbacterium sp.]|uniref:YhgE/Pip family protein n=1 Tax=Microbacterium sp. TaxID=51671 RepID=UPI0039E6678F
MNRITAAIEGARRVTWVTIVGVVLLPVVIGGLLVAALYNPVDRLDAMSAAIVNDDEPVTIDDQLVPLGRQLTAGLVEGSDDVPSNLDWTISNADDAAAGLADGRYAAVVTIPRDFSAAATSVQDGTTATQATIEVETAPDALVVDDAITATITQTAASVFGQTLSETYLENVFVGFSTLGDRLGDAADGAEQLADGAQSAADGAAQLPDGATQLASGASELSDGASELAGGLKTIARKTREAGSGAGKLADGLREAATGVVNKDLKDAAKATARNAAQAASDTKGVAEGIGGLLQQHCATSAPADPALCAGLNELLADATAAATSAGTASGYAAPTASGISELMSQTSAGLKKAAKSVDSMESGLGLLADGVGQSAGGARQLSSGAAQLGDGATELASGADQLADGVAELADGTDELADGLAKAADAVPVHDDSSASNLATVLSSPVKTTGLGTNLFGASAIPLLAMLALWVGGIASFVVLRAVPGDALTSRRPSAALALRTLWPAAAIGAAQGALVSGVVQAAASYDVAEWAQFALLCVLAGVAFAAVNQALVAVLGGAGRWVAAVVGVLAVATEIVSTSPGALTSLASLLPTAPAYSAMVGALTPAGGVGAGIAGLAIWGALAFAVTTVAVARRRTVSPRALLEPTPLVA